MPTWIGSKLLMVLKTLKMIMVNSSCENKSDNVSNEPVVIETIVVRDDYGNEKNNGDGEYQNFSTEFREPIPDDEP